MAGKGVVCSDGGHRFFSSGEKGGELHAREDPGGRSSKRGRTQSMHKLTDQPADRPTTRLTAWNVMERRCVRQVVDRRQQLWGISSRNRKLTRLLCARVPHLNLNPLRPPPPSPLGTTGDWNPTMFHLVLNYSLHCCSLADADDFLGSSSANWRPSHSATDDS